MMLIMKIQLSNIAVFLTFVTVYFGENATTTTTSPPSTCIPGTKGCPRERPPYNPNDYRFSCPHSEHKCVPFYECPEVIEMLRSDDDMTVEEGQLRYCGNWEPYGPLVCCLFRIVKHLPDNSSDYAGLPLGFCGFNNMHLLSGPIYDYMESKLPTQVDCEHYRKGNSSIRVRRCAKDTQRRHRRVHNRTRRKRLVGGEQSRLGQWPWLISIYFNYRDPEVAKAVNIPSPFGCIGTIISERFILTSAYCISKLHYQYGLKPIGITAGDFDIVNHEEDKNFDIINDVKYVLEQRPQHMDVELYIPRTHFNFVNYTDIFTNDIGLLKLTEPLQFNDYVQPICLPTSEAPKEVQAEEIAYSTVVSYAAYSIYKSPSLPRHIHLPAASVEDCKEYYTSYYEKPVQLNRKKVLCVGSKDSLLGLCNFDQGAPLMRSAGDGRMYQIGVAAQAGLEGCDVSKPNVFTRVDAYMGWIIESMKKYG